MAAVASGFLVAGTIAGLTGTSAHANVTAPIGGADIPVCVAGVGPDCPTTSSTTTASPSSSNDSASSDPVGGLVGAVTGAVTDTVGAVTGDTSGGSPLDPITRPVVDIVGGSASGGGGGTSSPTGTPLDPVLGPISDALNGLAGAGGGSDPVSGLLAPITDALSGSGTGSGNDAGPTGTPLDAILGPLSGGGAPSGAPDPGEALGDFGTQLIGAITQIEDAICASPLGDVLRAVHEGLAPALVPAKSALYEALNEIFAQLADALGNSDIALLPTAIQIIVDKLACPLSPETTSETPAGSAGEEPYAGGYGCGDYGGGGYGGGYGYGYGGGVCPTSESSGGATNPGDSSGTGTGSGGPTLPFTGAGLALAFLGAGLIAGGHLVRRLSRDQARRVTT